MPPRMPELDLTKRVLIPRVRGLEDSSRFWSVCMTLEHLVIVDSSIGGCIESLAKGVVPPGEASTAAVKPNPTADAGVIDRFEAVARDYLSRVDGLANLRTKEAYRHPWFGPLNALNWHRMAALAPPHSSPADREYPQATFRRKLRHLDRFLIRLCCSPSGEKAGVLV